MVKENKKIECKRVNINLPVTLIERVSEYAQKLGINSTSAYIVLLNQALDQKTALENLPEMMPFLSKIYTLQEQIRLKDKD